MRKVEEPEVEECHQEIEIETEESQTSDEAYTKEEKVGKTEQRESKVDDPGQGKDNAKEEKRKLITDYLKIRNKTPTEEDKKEETNKDFEKKEANNEKNKEGKEEVNVYHMLENKEDEGKEL